MPLIFFALVLLVSAARQPRPLLTQDVAGVDKEPKVSKDEVVVSLLRWRGATLKVDESHKEIIGATSSSLRLDLSGQKGMVWQGATQVID